MAPSFADRPPVILGRYRREFLWALPLEVVRLDLCERPTGPAPYDVVLGIGKDMDLVSCLLRPLRQDPPELVGPGA